MNLSKTLVESLLSWRDVSSILLNEKNMFGVKYLKVQIMFCVLKMLVIVARKFDIAHKLHELNCEQLTYSGIIINLHQACPLDFPAFHIWTTSL